MAETDEHRLALAEKVLAGALTMLEFEITLDQLEKNAAEAKKKGNPVAPPAGPGAGGYN
jgi:hypothetical protein